ncbi:MAG: DUF934 domain-containing protein [Parvibaculales bacterium]
MPLIKDQTFVDDVFVVVADDEALPDGAVLVSLDALKENFDSLKNRNSPFGVLISADNQGKTQLGEDVRELAPYLEALAVVALEFPTFRNGRGFSSARILRDEMSYQGEIRAVGDVAYDQWSYMARCGIDAFAVDEAVTLEQFRQATAELSDIYQPASDRRSGVPWRR